ncbi:hypothetical protein [Myxococcus sp. SDU36]|uniref:hypothetical protein n=1 Tax=Myxococcus sp. SDU36 TaxID=2831967 RepID=UPI00254283E9|nr:hypothetical protein [Myxococcus sp. SDU36]WIG94059.1 hypothetical protein KGD87_26385 [Myxococcus sp. SDU36]
MSSSRRTRAETPSATMKFGVLEAKQLAGAQGLEAPGSRAAAHASERWPRGIASVGSSKRFTAGRSTDDGAPLGYRLAPA